VDAVDAALTGGQMPAQMKTYIINAVAGTQDNLTRAQTALYLTAASSFYQVQH
jgi:3-hydroxyisobutyrate dehydrogenase-like beta-hydroxyacid dehydrogenase